MQRINSAGSSLRFDVAYTEPRNRLTNAFRIILAIPHLVIAGAWGYLVQVLAVVQWFIIVFTGKRHRGIFDLQLSQQTYYARVTAYVSQLFDPWPNIGPEQGDEPTIYRPVAYVEDADRLTCGLRIIWMIPALVVVAIIGIGACFVGIVAWFAILFTGSHPRGMWDFTLRYLRAALRLQAYGLLMTDEYPRYDGAEPTDQISVTAAPPAGSPLPPPPMPPPAR